MPATYEPISSTTLGSAASTITFSSIPSTYTDLVLTVNTTLSAEAYLQLRFNAATTNFSSTQLWGDGTSALSGRNTAGNAMYLTGRSSDGTTNPIFHKINIFSYAGSTAKTVLSEGAQDSNGIGSTQRVVGLWNSTAAISTVILRLTSGNFGAGTVATLYGIKAA